MVCKRVSHGKNLIPSDGGKTVKGSLILEVIFNLVPSSKRCEKSLSLILLECVPKGGSFFQKDSLITHILFELCLFEYLAQSTFFRDTVQSLSHIEKT